MLYQYRQPPNHKHWQHAIGVGILSAFFVSQSFAMPLANPTPEPSLFAVMLAEFSANRQEMPKALQLYKQQAKRENASPVFERALGLSLQHEPAVSSLKFASDWQENNPEHVPALFYVTHLALKAHEYELAGEKLNQILQADPDADLSQILLGIYPTETPDQAELLNVLQNLDIKNNTSLLVMKAGLLLQFSQGKEALKNIDKALKKSPKNPAFLTLKADILQSIAEPKTVLDFIQTARKTLPDNKSLLLYQTRYLIKQGKNQAVWQLLNDKKNQQFLEDDEIKLLAGLVGVDVEAYTQANALLLALTKNPNYKDQAYYYLGISAERQLHFNEAIDFYGKVMQPDLVLTARKSQIALLTNQERFADAIVSMEKLRAQFDEFMPQSYIIQASILNQAKQPQKAIELLDTAQKRLPENTDILFAKVLLLPDDTPKSQQQRLEILTKLRKLAPQNLEYQLEYAQVLVNQKQTPDVVESLLYPYINDTQIGLKARQILSQQSLHLGDSERVVMLLSDNFDIIPDVISGLLLQQAYDNLGNQNEKSRIEQILKTELHYPPTPQDF